MPRAPFQGIKRDKKKQAADDAFKSSLPFFQLIRVPLDVVPEEDEKLKEGLMVICPECEGWWIVKLSWRSKAYGRLKTHVCPWCSKCSRVPPLPPRE